MNKLAEFHRRLHRWYEAHGRKDLPWRNTRDAYAIYVSEIMLQQTQVATVLARFYEPFLARFPTLSALAAASRHDVLSAWQGLGYYSRAANLHEAAKIAGKKLPGSVEELIALPGIGRNTAHAIAAFAYHQPVAIMEANVKRVVSRIFALTEPKDIELWGKATELLDSKNPFDYNQAMMDIGATVCTRRAPACPICPARGICKGQTSPESYPAPKKKKATPVRRKSIVILQDSKGRYFAQPRSSRFLGGLYHFIEVDAGVEEIPFGRKRFTLNKAQHLGNIRQVYSHFALEAEIYRLRVPADSGNHWYSKEALAALPWSMAEQKILALLK